MKKWNENRPEVIRCACAIAKANEQGKEISKEVYKKMNELFSPDEIDAIASYLFYRSCGLTGADYLTPEQMDEAVEKECEKE